MPRRELIHSFQNGGVIDEGVPEFEKLLQRVTIHPYSEVGQRQKGLDLRGKDKALIARQRRIVERFHPERIARKEELLFARRPERKGEHAVEAIEACRSPLNETVQ